MAVMRTRIARTLVAAVCAVALASPPSPALAGEDAWRPKIGQAINFAKGRAGSVRIAVVDELGRFYGWHQRNTTPMASVLKVMLMTAYLRLPSVRDRGLRQKDRDLLEPMIRWSDNATASRVRDIVGGSRLNALADRAGMRDFSFHYSPWGLSRTSARDQARFMFRLERWIPNRHEAYARQLLRTIVRSQRWGIPPEVPDGWRIFFKGGWGSGTGWVTHQVAFLKNGDRRIAIAILVRDSPNHTYGTRTIRGVARRLLKGL